MNVAPRGTVVRSVGYPARVTRPRSLIIPFFDVKHFAVTGVDRDIHDFLVRGDDLEFILENAVLHIQVARNDLAGNCLYRHDERGLEVDPGEGRPLGGFRFPFDAD